MHRSYNPRVPHMSALLAGQSLAPPPPSVDYTKGMPANLGMMLNDTLGDCTCAAVYHAIQVWSFNAQQKIDTEPDPDVEKLYVLACGYNPRVGGEGPGGNEQHVLTYLLKHGAPIGPAGKGRHKIAAFVEVDPRNVDDVKRTIDDCGVAYIGFNVPAYIVPPPPAAPPAVWDVETKNASIVGGHAVVLAGYDAKGARRDILGLVLHDDMGVLRQICRRSLRHRRPGLGAGEGHDSRRIEPGRARGADEATCRRKLIAASERLQRGAIPIA